MKIINALQVLKAFVERHGSQREAAKALGISESYLSDIVHGRRAISRGLLGVLGLREVKVTTEKAS